MPFENSYGKCQEVKQQNKIVLNDDLKTVAKCVLYIKDKDKYFDIMHVLVYYYQWKLNVHNV